MPLVIGYSGETPQMLQQTIDFIYKTKPDYISMCEAVPYLGTELYNYAKKVGLELSKDWSQYHEQTQVFKNTLLLLSKLEQIKKEFYDSYFSPAFYLKKKVKGDFCSQIMARMPLNHLVRKYGVTRWAFKTLGKMRQPKKAQVVTARQAKNSKDKPKESDGYVKSVYQTSPRHQILTVPSTPVEVGYHSRNLF